MMVTEGNLSNNLLKVWTLMMRVVLRCKIFIWQILKTFLQINRGQACNTGRELQWRDQPSLILQI